jgi:hypothetical protein
MADQSEKDPLSTAVKVSEGKWDLQVSPAFLQSTGIKKEVIQSVCVLDLPDLKVNGRWQKVTIPLPQGSGREWLSVYMRRFPSDYWEMDKLAYAKKERAALAGISTQLPVARVNLSEGGYLIEESLDETVTPLCEVDYTHHNTQPNVGTPNRVFKSVVKDVAEKIHGKAQTIHGMLDIYSVGFRRGKNGHRYPCFFNFNECSATLAEVGDPLSFEKKAVEEIAYFSAHFDALMASHNVMRSADDTFRAAYQTYTLNRRRRTKAFDEVPFRRTFFIAYLKMARLLGYPPNIQNRES